MAIKNPKRSGGPKTSEGKALVSQNATKFGTYSSLSILPNENPEEFNQIVDQFNHDFHPADMIETTLVRELAIITWKKLRLEKLENNYFIKKTNAPITLNEFMACNLKFDQLRYDFWINDRKLEDYQLKNARETLALIKPIMRVGISNEQLSQIKKLNDPIYRSLIDFYRRVDPLAEEELSDIDIIEMTIKLAKQPEQFITSVVFEKYIAYYEAAIWVTEHQADIEDAILQIKQERILNIMQSESTQRANDDLSRAFARTLNEFRKHHQWRMQNLIIDADKE